jgi:uncharacterized protein
LRTSALSLHFEKHMGQGGAPGLLDFDYFYKKGNGMNPLLSQKLPRIQRILRKNKVKRAYAFGSVVTERFSDNSDVDILIAFEEGLDPIDYGDRYFEVLDSLQELLGRDVDLVTEKSLKSSYFSKEVNKTKVPLLE